jgi:hypothetical protein
MSDLSPGSASRASLFPKAPHLEASSGSESGFSENEYADLVNPYTPALVLSPDGFVHHLTEAARRLLEYRPDQEFDSYFFTHVHGKNMHRVMRDLAAMVKHGSEKASWLLRMRTGRSGRWRWYRAEATNCLSLATPAITVRLRDLHQW